MEQIGQLRAFNGFQREIVVTVLRAFRARLTEHHFGMLDEIAVDGEAVRVLTEVNPVFIHGNGMIPLLQEDDVRDHISNEDLLKVLRNEGDLAFMLADKLSFQRPGIIAENFRALDNCIDIAAWLRKPYHNRKKTLFDSIAELIDVRDRFVHTGIMTLDLSDKRIKRIIDDLNEAADRVYDGFGDVYGFEPSYSF